MSIKLKFRASADAQKEGILYYQVICERVVRQIHTDYHIFASEWDHRRAVVLIPHESDELRKVQVAQIVEHLHRDLSALRSIEQHLMQTGVCSAHAVIEKFREASRQDSSVFNFMYHHAVRLKELKRWRSYEHCITTLNSFKRFRNDVNLEFCDFNAALVEDYEAYLSDRRLTRNTCSFYLRTLRCVYNHAVSQGIATQPGNPFVNVYTGIDKTVKRAIGLADIKRIKQLDLSENHQLDYARNIFMLCFYLRGISFIDLSFLRKKDLCEGKVSYARRKTRQQLTIHWEKEMDDLLSTFAPSATQYLLPIIKVEDGTEQKQYTSKMAFVNRHLKTIGKLAHIGQPLTLYVTRHSWSSIARRENVPIAVISEALGHDSEATTQIYLASIQSKEVDNANRKILNHL